MNRYDREDRIERSSRRRRAERRTDIPQSSMVVTGEISRTLGDLDFLLRGLRQLHGSIDTISMTENKYTNKEIGEYADAVIEMLDAAENARRLGYRAMKSLGRN